MSASVNSKAPRVALVCDWLVIEGGAERVLKCLHDLFPEAPIFTLVYDAQKAPAWCRECDVRTTYVQRWPGAKSHYRLLLPFMPRAWEALDLMEFDLVVSLCSSCCKGVLTRPDAAHVCFCHTPTRYVWDLYYDYLSTAGTVKRAIMPRLIHKVRQWDFQAAQRVDCFVANSDYVGRRIKKYYHRDSLTIHPGTIIPPAPVSAKHGDYYLVVSRFVGYKRVDLAIQACDLLGRRLVVVGSGGNEEARLHRMAGSTVEFAGHASDEELHGWYDGARALLFPGVEDFGLVPVEAMAHGCPVLAYGAGGALETVVDGETGLFFCEQTPEALAACIEQFEAREFSATACRKRAGEFSEEKFKREMAAFCEDALTDAAGGKQ